MPSATPTAAQFPDAVTQVLDGREAVLAQVNKFQRAGVKQHLGKYYIRALRAVTVYRNRHFYSASSGRACGV